MIARVFTRKTKQSPGDRHCYFTVPGLVGIDPEYDEVRVSVTFTWDIEHGEHLKKQWGMVCNNVKIGGPAFGDRGGDFVGGRYLRNGVTITSRGCPNNCSFCFVPQREGQIRELKITPGNFVQDNNLLACSRNHIDRVFEMLKGQKGVEFPGGLEPARIDDYIVEKLRGISIEQIWLSHDYEGAEKALRYAVEKLRKHFKRRQMRCYVLVGGPYEDTVEKAEARLIKAWEIGTLPFAMLWQQVEFEDYSPRWKKLVRNWTRPAFVKEMAKSNFKNARY